MQKSPFRYGLVFAALISAAAAFAAAAAEWPHTDIPPDPAVRLGVLANGMRYAIMKNQTPAGAVSVRFGLLVGSTYEARDERGFSHFVEHMAFRGSKNFPDGEIHRTLERLGLRPGADTNAMTGQDMTIYKFDLPTADPAAVADALAIARDIAGNLDFDSHAVQTEAGVIMSEAAMRGSPSFRSNTAELDFELADSRASAMPGSDPSIIKRPWVSELLDYYRAWYRPERAILTIVGDIDPDQLANQIAERFADWRAIGDSGKDPVFHIAAHRGLEARIQVEPAIPDRVSLAWVQPPVLHPVDRSTWKTIHIDAVALQILNRRFAALAASPDHPFTGAQAMQRDASHAAEVFTLSAAYDADKWQAALTGLAQARLALLHTGISQAEIDSVVTAQKALQQRLAMSADTRATPALADALAVRAGQGDIIVNLTQARAASDEDITGLTPDVIQQAFRDMIGASDPLIFVSSRRAVAGGEEAVVDAFRAVVDDANASAAPAQDVKWPYTDFGPPGQVVETGSAPDIGITSLHFANNVRLVVRPSKSRLNQVLVSVRFGNGRLGLPKDNPTANWLFGSVVPGGLGALSSTEMVTALSGKNYRIGFSVGDGAFAFSGETTPQDLETQLQIFAAYIKDPGFRPTSFEQFKQQYIGRVRAAVATPSGMLGLVYEGVVHDGDKRWAVPALGDVRTASIDDLRALAGPAFAQTPMEVVITGDTTVEAASRAVATTLGALPARPDGILKLTPENKVDLPATAADPLVLHTTIPSSLALASVAWVAHDFYADLADDAAVHLLATILHERLLDAVRGKGLSYAVQVLSPSSTAFDHGYIMATATMPPGKSQVFYDAADTIVADLKAGRITDDEFQRIRAPMLQDFRRIVQTNAYWSALLNGGWDEKARFDRARNYEQVLESRTAADVAAAARKFLTGEHMIRISAGS